MERCRLRQTTFIFIFLPIRKRKSELVLSLSLHFLLVAAAEQRGPQFFLNKKKNQSGRISGFIIMLISLRDY